MNDITRREFIKWSAMAAVATMAGCSAPQQAAPAPQPTARPTVQAAQEWHKSVCRFCGTGCGVQLGIADGKLVALRGDPEHPTTKGLVCAKALFLPKIVYSPDRLTKPQIRKGGKLVDATWDEAMNLVADKFAEAIKTSGPDSVAYYGSGQALAEESYLANRLFKGGIGTNNVDGNPRLCMASAVGGYTTTYGKDEPMGSYDDIDHARTFFLIGSNTAEAHPVLFDRILDRKSKNANVQIILVDPRKTPVRRVTDLYLDPIPGFDLDIFHAMAQVIIADKLHDPDFIAKHLVFRKVVDGQNVDVPFDEYVKFLEAFTPEKAAEKCGVPATKIRQAARMFAQGPTMSLWCMGLNQRTVGVWANNLIHNLHLITGQFGKPGATPFSLTGQPNACGGVRDPGALAHLLPYGRVIANADHRAQMEKLWGAPAGKIKATDGLNTIDMFKALGEDKIKAMIIITTNPGQSLPNANKYRDAMGKERPSKPFIVSVDAYPTRTTELADVVLPAAMWSEKEGVFGMSERRYQLMPKLIQSPGEARSDFDILLDFAKRLEDRGVVAAGYISSKFKTTADVWLEMMEASRNTAYDFTGMSRERMKKERGVRWPVLDETHPGTSRRFVKGDDPLLDKGPFADANLKPGDIKIYVGANNKAIVWLRPSKDPAEPADKDFPFVLSTGRVLEHWHTATMTMKAPELRRAQPEAYCEVHPLDAEKLGIKTGDMVKLTSRRGDVTVRARVVDTPRPGMVFVPMHWYEDNSLINKVTIDAYDPASRQPEFKVCAVKVEKGKA
jgi:nitrate reductase NapA